MLTSTCAGPATIRNRLTTSETDHEHAPEDLPLSGFERNLIEIAFERTPAPGRFAARNAVRHLERAWRIRKVDPEMAVFRGITGEEEAARAIIHALQRRRYPGAEQLNWRKHTHKAAIVPFMEIISRLAARMPSVGWQFEIVKEDPEPVRLRIPVKIDGVDQFAYPDPPLNLSIGGPHRRYAFDRETNELLSTLEAKTLEDAIRKRANERNRLLYASEQGFTVVDPEPAERSIVHRRSAVMAMLGVYTLIDVYSEHQRFVTDTLSTFERLLQNLRR